MQTPSLKDPTQVWSRKDEDDLPPSGDVMQVAEPAAETPAEPAAETLSKDVEVKDVGVKDVKVKDEEDEEDEEDQIPALAPRPQPQPQMQLVPRRRVAMVFDTMPLVHNEVVYKQWRDLIATRWKVDRMHVLSYTEEGIGRYISLAPNRFKDYMRGLRKGIEGGHLQIVVPTQNHFRTGGKSFYNLLVFKKETAYNLSQGRSVHADMHAYCVMSMLTVGTMLSFHNQKDSVNFAEWLMKDIKVWDDTCYTFYPTADQRAKLTAHARTAVDLEQSTMVIQWKKDVKPAQPMPAPLMNASVLASQVGKFQPAPASSVVIAPAEDIKDAADVSQTEVSAAADK